MPNVTALFKRLEKVNTALNLIEDCWPHRQPTDNKIKQLKFSFDPKRLASKHVRSIEQQAQRLADNVPGWEVTVDVYAFTGRDAGCVINVFFNGSSAGRTGCQVYNMDLKNTSTSFTPSLQACVEQWPAEVDRLIAKFKTYPAKAFKTKKYKALYKTRQVLNKQWHAIPETHAANVPGPYAYPYGKHSPGWPTD